MKYAIEGTIGRDERPFKVEFEADSEKHALELAYAKVGTTEKVKMAEIEVLKIQKVK